MDMPASIKSERSRRRRPVGVLLWLMCQKDGMSKARGWLRLSSSSSIGWLGCEASEETEKDHHQGALIAGRG